MSEHSLRPETPEDEPFLRRLFASTHSDLAGLPDMILEMQFRAQRMQYSASYPSASREIVVLDGVAVGNLVVDRSSSEVRLVDVGLLPEFRGHGIGSALVSELIASGLPVSLHVAKGNPAQRLYARLGFEVVGDDGVYVGMRRLP